MENDHLNMSNSLYKPNSRCVHPKKILVCCSNANITNADELTHRLKNVYGWTCLLAINDNELLTEMLEECSVFVIYSSTSAENCQKMQAIVSHALLLGKKRLEAKDYTPLTIDTLNQQLCEIFPKKTYSKPSSYVEGYASTSVVGPKSLFYVALFVIAAILGAMASGIFDLQAYQTDILAIEPNLGFNTPVLTARIGSSLAKPEAIVEATIQAKQGGLSCKYSLGNMFLRWGDNELAMHWFKAAAEYDYANACAALSRMYRNGRGVEPSIELAMKWAHRAAENGHFDMQVDIFRRYYYGDELPQNYEQAAFWLSKAADQDSIEAQLWLGQMHVVGDGIPQNNEQAAYWTKRAAELGSDVGQVNIGFFYAIGQGVPQCFVESAYWFRKAAEQGHPNAMTNLGWQYENGFGLPQDYDSAAYWYFKALMLDDAIAKSSFGYLLMHGYGVVQNYEQAAFWLKTAVDYCQRAQYNLGFLYETGAGVEQCYVQAKHWYQQAANAGNQMAHEALERLAVLGI